MASLFKLERLNSALFTAVVSAITGILVACGGESPTVSELSNGSETQVVAGQAFEPQSITLYYDGDRQSVTIRDAAILFAAFSVTPTPGFATPTPTQLSSIVSFANQLGIDGPPIDEDEVIGLVLNPASPILSDFNQDGVVDIEDVAVLFGLATLGTDAPIADINSLAAQLLGFTPEQIGVTEAGLNQFLTPEEGINATFFVDSATGDDSNTGQTPDQPFASLQNVLINSNIGNGSFPTPFELAEQGGNVTITVQDDQTIDDFITTFNAGPGSVTIVGKGVPTADPEVTLNLNGNLTIDSGVKFQNFNFVTKDAQPNRRTVLVLLDGSEISDSFIGDGTAVSTNPVGPTVFVTVAENSVLERNKIQCKFAALGDVCIVSASQDGVNAPRIVSNTISEVGDVGGTLLQTVSQAFVNKNTLTGSAKPSSVLIDVAAGPGVQRIDGNTLNVGNSLNATGINVKAGTNAGIGALGGNTLRNTFVAQGPNRGFGIKGSLNTQAGPQGLLFSNNFPDFTFPPSNQLFVNVDNLVVNNGPTILVQNNCTPLAPEKLFTVKPGTAATQILINNVPAAPFATVNIPDTPVLGTVTVQAGLGLVLTPGTLITVQGATATTVVDVSVDTSACGLKLL